MSIVEIYHSPLRRSCFVIKNETPDIENAYALKLVVKAINDSIGPDSLVPTLFVFGTLPRLSLPTYQQTSPTFKRAVALRKATEKMSRHFAKRQVRNAMNVRNNPNVTAIHTTSIGSPMIVYRHEKDKWKVQFSLFDIHAYDCIVLLSYPAGTSKLRSTVVKPFFKDTPTTDNNGNTTDNTRSVCSNLVTTFHGTEFVRVFLSRFSSNVLEFDDDFISAWKTVL